MVRLIPILLTLAIVTSCTQRITVVKAKLEDSQVRTRDYTSQSDLSEPAYDNYLNDGLILFRQGNFQGAHSLFKRAVDTDTAGWQGYYYSGLALGKLEKHALAQSSFLSSLTYAPDDKRTRSLIYLAMAEGWEKQGKLGRAELNYITALNLCPDSSPATNGLERIQLLRLRSRK